MNEYQREYLVSVGERPWGKYTVLLNGEDHKVKEITVNPGERLSTAPSKTGRTLVYSSRPGKSNPIRQGNHS